LFSDWDVGPCEDRCVELAHFRDWTHDNGSRVEPTVCACHTALDKPDQESHGDEEDDANHHEKAHQNAEENVKASAQVLVVVGWV